MLLSWVADHLFWGARYLERAECTARIVRTFTEVIVDLPTGLMSSWEPLLAVAGSRDEFDATHARAGETDIVRFLVADPENPSSVLSSIGSARENLRTTREVLPREAWQVVNDLHLYALSNGEAAVDRRSRNRVLTRIVAEGQRLDGVLTSAMSRDEAYEMWRLGQSIERADMTTRVVGVRAAALLALPADADDYDEVQWMGVLRSLSRDADVPALPPRSDRRAERGPLPAHRPAVPALGAGLRRQDPPGAHRAAPLRGAAPAGRRPRRPARLAVGGALGRIRWTTRSMRSSAASPR